jgi:chromobox protein 1
MAPRKRQAAKASIALSDEETSEVELAVPLRRGRKSTSTSAEPDAASNKRRSSTRSIKYDDKAAAADPDDEEDQEEEDDEEEDVFVVEKIVKHMIDEDGTLKFHVKWEGYDDKADMTWEPEENLECVGSEDERKCWSELTWVSGCLRRI